MLACPGLGVYYSVHFLNFFDIIEYGHLFQKVENDENIPDICHGRADGVRVNFFWPV